MSASMAVAPLGQVSEAVAAVPPAEMRPGVFYRHVAHQRLRHYRPKDWLSDGEHEVLATLRNPARRESWFSGRVLAKQLVLEHGVARTEGGPQLHPAQVEIHSRDGLGRRVQPRVLLDGRFQKYSLSIAHSARSVLVALSMEPDVYVGADVTPLQIQNQGFSQLWLTPNERTHAGQADALLRPYFASQLWAVKEAFYKAWNTGQPFVPANIEVQQDGDGDWSVWLEGRRQSRCNIFVTETDNEVVAIVAAKRTQSTL